MPEQEEPSSRLTVVEVKTAFLVVWEDCPDDWLARFEKNDGFPARAWAENMAHVHNGRLAGQRDGPPTPRGVRPATFHPQ